MVSCNSTLEDERVDEDPLGSGSLSFHQIGLIISAIFGLVATFIALWLIYLHGTHYSRPWEQKHIIRILFMIPIYAVVSFLSFKYYPHAIYFQVIRDCYEAFAIASFFTLLCHYVAPSLHDQKDYFRSQKPKNWVLPLNWFQKCTGGKFKGPLRLPTSGLTWFNIMWIGIFQYCFVHICMTFLALVTQATKRYCGSSLNPAFAHIWVSVFNALGVTIAMYCIIQFYYQIKDDIREHKPILKLACIKLVIFFSFWQNFLISLSSTHVTVTRTMSYPDIKVGVPSILLCIEMAIFSVLHIFAFPYKPYSHTGTNALTAPGGGYSGQARYKGGPFGIYAYAEAFNPWDIIKASARGFRWLFVGVRYRHDDTSYQHTRGESSTGGFGGYGARYPSGSVGSTDGNASSIYSSTKLGPVGKGGPTRLERERHISSEYVARERDQRERDQQREMDRNNGIVPDFGAAPRTHGGDLGDAGLPRSEGPEYHPGKRAYYGDELPPAPVPMPAMPSMGYDDDDDRGGYGGGRGTLSPYASHDEHSDRGHSPGSGSGGRRSRSRDEDRAALLADQKGGGSGGGGLHPAYRRG